MDCGCKFYWCIYYLRFLNCFLTYKLDAKILFISEIVSLPLGYFLLWLTLGSFEFSLLSGYVLITTAALLSPLLHTFTLSWSDDTIYCISICFSIIHLFVHPYFEEDDSFSHHYL
eukprot:UN14921